MDSTSNEVKDSQSAFTTANQQSKHRRTNTADSLQPDLNKDSLNQSSIGKKEAEQNTCVKLQNKKQNRYSSSPLGKRFDIYETTEDSNNEE